MTPELRRILHDMAWNLNQRCKPACEYCIERIRREEENGRVERP